MINLDKFFNELQAPPLGQSIDLTQWGLYTYTTNRFLYTNSNKKTIEKIQRILKSKVYFKVVDLHLIPNWHPTIIDNTVCDHWGLLFHNNDFDDATLEDYLISDDQFNWLLPFVVAIEKMHLSYTNIIELHKDSLLGVSKKNNDICEIVDYFDPGVFHKIKNQDDFNIKLFDTEMSNILLEIEKICFWSSDVDELFDKLYQFFNTKNSSSKYKEILIANLYDMFPNMV